MKEKSEMPILVYALLIFFLLFAIGVMCERMFGVSEVFYEMVV